MLATVAGALVSFLLPMVIGALKDELVKGVFAIAKTELVKRNLLEAESAKQEKIAEKARVDVADAAVGGELRVDDGFERG
jgi:hypothetical protein